MPDTCELPEVESPNKNPRGKPAVYSDCLAMQRVIKAAALKKGCKPSEQAQLARAYVELEKLKRITRGLAANTSQTIKPESARRPGAQSSGPVLESWIEPPPGSAPVNAPINPSAVPPSEVSET